MKILLEWANFVLFIELAQKLVCFDRSGWLDYNTVVLRLWLLYKRKKSIYLIFAWKGNLTQLALYQIKEDEMSYINCNLLSFENVYVGPNTIILREQNNRPSNLPNSKKKWKICIHSFIRFNIKKSNFIPYFYFSESFDCIKGILCDIYLFTAFYK